MLDLSLPLMSKVEAFPVEKISVFHSSSAESAVLLSSASGLHCRAFAPVGEARVPAGGAQHALYPAEPRPAEVPGGDAETDLFHPEDPQGSPQVPARTSEGRTCTCATTPYLNESNSSFRSDLEEPCRPTGCSMQEKNETDKGSGVDNTVQSGFTLTASVAPQMTGLVSLVPTIPS